MNATKLLMFLLLLFALSSCNNYDEAQAKKAIDRYMQKVLYKPDSYRAIRYYKAQRLKITKEEAEQVNSAISGRNTQPFNGWTVAVDIEAMSRDGRKSEQGANFYLNLACDTVISSDVGLHFCKEGN